MDPRTRRHALFFVLVTILLDTVAFGIVLPVMPELIMELTGEGLGRAAVYGGWLAVLFASTNFLSMPVLGNLSDRFGRRPILIGSLLALALTTLLIGLATSFVWLVVARLIQGAAGAAYGTANAYVADISPPDERAQNFAMIGAAFGVGFIVGPAVGGLLGGLGSRVPFYVAAGVALLNVAYGFLVLPESLAPEHRRRFEWRRANALVSISALRRYPVVGGLVAIVLLHQLAFQVLPSVWNFFTMYRFGWSEAEVGYSLAFSGTMMILVQAFLVRRLVPRLGEHRAASIGLLFTAIGYYVYALGHASWTMYAGMALASLSGLVSPSLNAIMSKEVGPTFQGELQGAVGSVVSLTMIVGPIVMTQLFGYFTSREAPFEFPGAPFFASAALATLALWLLLRRRRAVAVAPSGAQF